jgi:hypothetical protein
LKFDIEESYVAWVSSESAVEINCIEVAGNSKEEVH